MNVIDSSAWLSYFAGDANAEIFSTPIENIEKLIVLASLFPRFLNIFCDNEVRIWR